MKKLKIYAISVMAMLCLQLTANSQSYFYNERYYDSPVLTELGLSLGAMNCLTDLGGRSGTGKNLSEMLTGRTPVFVLVSTSH
jgi:hypothetical protein